MEAVEDLNEDAQEWRLSAPKFEAGHFSGPQQRRPIQEQINKAIREQQMLHKDARDTCARTIKDMAQDHSEIKNSLEKALKEVNEALWKQGQIFELKRSTLTREVGEARTQAKDLQLKLERLEDEFSREEKKSESLEKQLSESRAHESLIQRIEQHMGDVSERLNELDEKAEQADEIPVEVVERLDEISACVHSPPNIFEDGEIREMFRSLENEIIIRLTDDMKGLMSGQTDIHRHIQGLEKSVHEQNSLVRDEQKAQRQLQDGLAERTADTTKLTQMLQANEVQASGLMDAVHGMAQKLKDLTETSISAAKGAALDEELYGARKRITEIEAHP
ncbi:hypothetical protein CTRI78_v005108 [Colletotrichum trifolii]|uniref:Uncharacterized protein n=1 Tax=Colletotrichum trifolii TaxID=5466 RepID=A0A4R8RS87_COLTR|nr:hypothetical protein CTRI78_v005108 [Colletotrichum trifolii]